MVNPSTMSPPQSEHFIRCSLILNTLYLLLLLTESAFAIAPHVRMTARKLRRALFLPRVLREDEIAWRPGFGV
ncbi:MAG: hypothetical protein DMF68_15060 [Acidobacteria bacterium]|nr:MAG: hypothetical protein DMF68_15060 [Acidobacteriota bacterium]